nr:hypothetical protein [Peptoclostridium litorale]
MCSGETQEIKSITVKYFVLDNLVNTVRNECYYICLNENCDVVYYNQENQIFKKQDMKIPI